jgi:hypothetical protein
MTTAVAHKPRGQPRWTDEAVTSFIAATRALGGRRADDPARRGGGRLVVRRGAQKQAECVARGGREREPPRHHLIDTA